MNCRAVKVLAVAIGVCVAAATASNALAAKDKAKHGVVADIKLPKAVADSKSPKTGDAKSGEEHGKIMITETDKATKASTTNPYDLSESVSVQINGEPGELKDIAVGDKIAFKLTDGKVSVIMKGHKKKSKQ
ncbi:MAG TPA: hypothetical protein VHX65_11650 [Pirellulales bacterium]|jgi:hypothetical protein|nr:hypothetical protein [Pirellulales bacterium]